MTTVRAVVLAAGKGTRMKSARPKVLLELCGRPMLWYPLRALRDGGVSDATLVVTQEVEEHVEAIAQDAGCERVRSVVQRSPLGTGHAAKTALQALDPHDGTVIILYADMPLIDGELIRRLIDARDGALALVTAHMPLPCNFGRVVRHNGRVERIVEERDASEDELAIDEMNAGLYAFDETKLRDALARLRTDNNQGEYYLTDAVALLAGSGERVVPVVAADYHTVLGVNDPTELAVARALLGA